MILLLRFVGWIDTLLSWRGFIPLSRLTYTVYLIHLPVMDTLAHTARNGEIFTILKFVSKRERSYLFFYESKAAVILTDQTLLLRQRCLENQALVKEMKFPLQYFLLFFF